LKKKYIQAALEVICCETVFPAEGMELRFSEEVVTIFTDSVQPREDALVVDTFALDFKEGALVK